MTRKTAVIITLSIYAILIVYSGINAFPTYGLYQVPYSPIIYCTPLNNINWIENIVPWIDFVIYIIAPSTIMIVANVLIIWKLREMRKQRRLMTRTESNEENKGYGGNRIAVMLICVSTFFILTTMPWGIFFIGKYLDYLVCSTCSK